MNPVMILAAIAQALKLAQEGMSIYQRWQAGDHTEAQAEAEWAKTREAFSVGAAAWDAAGAMKRD